MLREHSAKSAGNFFGGSTTSSAQELLQALCLWLTPGGDWGNYMWSWELNLNQLLARQIPYLLYYDFSPWRTFLKN